MTGDFANNLGLIGLSDAIAEVRERIRLLAKGTLPILIEGPTGSGKELVARALHISSGRTGANVAVNVCAVGEQLFESALFGHVRGAFTGATVDSPGFLREADRGTLFLDELAGLPVALQAKLLRSIEEREFRPVGARRDAQSDFRLVSATNVPLDRLRADGLVRVDFAFRISAARIRIPPLEQRPEDILPLANHFLRTISARNDVISESVSCLLRDHQWPGNVRELRNVVESASVLGAGVLREEVVSEMLGSSRTTAPRSARQSLLRLLEAHGWSARAVATVTGSHRSTIYRMMRRWGIAGRADRKFGSPANLSDAVRA